MNVAAASSIEEAPNESAVGAVGPVVRLVVLGAVSYALCRLGPEALALVAALWLLALPGIVGPRAAVRREWIGAAFVFLVAAQVDVLEVVFSLRHQLLFSMCGLGAIYLWRRSAELREVLRAPVTIAFLVFVGQEVVSAWAAGAEEVAWAAGIRVLLVEGVLAAAVLVRRPGGRRLLPAVMVAAALMSLPVLLREVIDPTHFQWTVIGDGDEVRAGGFYNQPNVAGIALDFAIAFAGALYFEGALEARTVWALVAACGLGILCTVSRGAFIVGLLAIAALWPLASLRRGATPAVALRGVLVVAAAAMLLPLLGQGLLRLSDDLDNAGVTDISRLQEATLALTGHTEAMAEDDSRRLQLVEEAEQRIAAKPIFGWGTSAFMHGDVGAHVEFLQVLGENGLVGLALYALLLAGIAHVIWRLPGRDRLSVGLVAGVWLLTHFHNHNLMETPFMALPLGYVCGVAPDARS